MRTIRRLMPMVAGSVLLSTLGACAGRGLVTREYVLTPMTMESRSGELTTGPRTMTVGVGPVELPGYLRRPQIVTREDQNQLLSAQAHRWAGGLEPSLSRALSENLSLLIPTNRVLTYPWRQAGTLDYSVAVQILRFERGPDQLVSLEARWVLARGRGGDVLTVGRSSISKPTNGSGYGAAVEAMSQAVAELSREIAGAIQKEARNRL